MREQYVEAVLAVADLIPSAQVLTYGDIAALLECGGPRNVGAAMAAQGGAVAWWRVVRANGAAPGCHGGTALEQYLQERTPLRGDTAAMPPSWRIDMAAARWRPAAADFHRIDTIAARLQDADDADRPTPSASPPLLPARRIVGPGTNVSTL